MKVLGIETSCDETAAAVVELDKSSNLTLLSNEVASSMDQHTIYGGVVPEIAARSHIEYIMPVVNKALEDAKCNWNEIDAIAVTQGPGLGGSLLIGLTTARTLSVVKNKPLYPVNHVAAHPIAAFISNGSVELSYPKKAPKFPCLSLIVSGGHTQIVLYKTAFKYKILGQTRDDAVGEAFDKVAKIIGLPYPGGPSVENAGDLGDSAKYRLPKAKLENKYDFSYSGLKTAVLRTAQEEIGEDFTFPSTKIPDRLTDEQVNDIAASFQKCAIEILVDKMLLAIEEFAPKSVVIAGGVAASRELRKQAEAKFPIKPIFPNFKLCTDNGAMIAAFGCLLISSKKKPTLPYSLDIEPNLSM